MTTTNSFAKDGTGSPNRLEASRVSKAFGAKQVVNRASFHVESKEVVGLLGPNGAGKTTSFNMVIGLESCDDGCVALNNTDISHLPIYRRAQLGIGYLPQQSSIFRRLSVEKNISAVLETRSDMSTDRKRSFLDEILELFRIESLRDQLATTLSGGERRRVEIGRAFALEPRFMLLDEPFAGVDPIAIEEVAGLISLLVEKNVGVLITDHNVRETLKICNRAYILHEGEVIVSGTPEEIMDSPSARRYYFGENFRI